MAKRTPNREDIDRTVFGMYFPIEEESSPEDNSPERISPEVHSDEIPSAEFLSPETPSPEFPSGERTSPENASPQQQNSQNRFEETPDIPEPVRIDLARGFYKTDNDIDDVLMPYLKSGPLQLVYRLLYRHSYGWNSAVCDRLTVQDMVDLTGLSDRTVQAAIKQLVALGCIVILKESDRNNPRQYWVKLPCQIDAIKDKCKRQLSTGLGEFPSGESNSPEASTGSGAKDIHPNSEGISPENASPQGDLVGMSRDFDEAAATTETPKDTRKTSLKDNNIPADVVDKLRLLGIQEPVIKEWLSTYGADEIRYRLEVFEYVVQYRREKRKPPIDSPAGWIATALEKKIDFPNSYYKTIAGQAANNAAKQLAATQKPS